METNTFDLTHDTAVPPAGGGSNLHRSLPVDIAAPLRPVAHLDGVDALRGLAALMIVVYHTFATASTPAPEWRVAGLNLLRPIHDGWCAVNLFLVLSGFCLFWPYARDPRRVLRFGDFMRRRCLRILPAYYAALLVVPILYAGVAYLNLCTPHAGTPRNTTDVLVHIAMLHSFTPRYFTSWNGVSWSLGLEWTWYLAFPIALWIFRRCGAPRGLLILCVCALSYRLSLYFGLGPARRFPESALEYTFALRTFLLGRLIEFSLGMFVAWWVAKGPIPRRTLLMCGALIPPLFIAARFGERVDDFLPVRDALYGVAFALLLAIMASSPHAARSFKSGSWFRSIGVYSYSLYLFHMPFVHFACGVFSRGFHATPLHTFAGALLFIPLTLFACKLAYRCFEAPFMNLRVKDRAARVVATPRESMTPHDASLPAMSSNVSHQLVTQ